MPVPSEFKVAPNSPFAQLHGQLAQEHEKEVAEYRRRLKDVMSELARIRALSHESAKPFLVDDAATVEDVNQETTEHKQRDVQKSVEEKGDICQQTDVKNMKANQTCVDGKDGKQQDANGHKMKDAPQCIETGVSMHSFVAASSMKSDEDTKMHWGLESMTPEEEDALDLARRLSKWMLAQYFGLSTERLKHVILNWWRLHEPQRNRSFLHRMIASKRFDTFILTIIFLNIVFIFWVANEDITSLIEDPLSFHEEASFDARFWIDFGFTSFYLVELILKLYSHRHFFFIAADYGWNIFDTILVVFSVFDVALTVVTADHSADRPNLSFLRALRMMRIVRVLRMVRAVRWVNELRLMLDCVLHSVYHLFWCLVLITAVLLIFALLLIQGTTDHLVTVKDDPSQFPAEAALVAETFDSVPNAMLSLFKATTGGDDWANYYSVIKRSGWFFDVVFLFYIAFFAIVAWNIVMSIFVEKTMNLAAPDIDTMIMEKKRKDAFYAKELTAILEECLDDDGDHVISIDEFRQHMTDKKVRNFFQARNLDMKDAELFFRMLASVQDGNGQVDINTFVMGCMQLRGMASNIDVQSLHYEMKYLFRQSRLETNRLIEALQEHLPKSEEVSITETV